MASKGRQGMSQRAYAAHRGVSHTAVQQAVRAERIPTFPDGSIDPERADHAWATNTDVSKPDNSVRGRRARRSAATGDEPPPTDGGEAAPSSGWQKNRTAREGYAALLTKTRYEREIGDSVNVHDVRQGAFATAKKLQGEALAMPEQLSSEGAMRTREELFEILKAWVVKFCQDLQVPVQREP